MGENATGYLTADASVKMQNSRMTRKPPIVARGKLLSAEAMIIAYRPARVISVYTL